MRFFKGNRTRAFGTVVLILGVIEQYAREVFPEELQGFILMFIGVAVIILRQITTTAPGKSDA